MRIKIIDADNDVNLDWSEDEVLTYFVIIGGIYVRV